MPSLEYTISPSGAGKITWSASWNPDPFNFGTIRWTITESTGYSGYEGAYTKGPHTFTFTKGTDPGGTTGLGETEVVRLSVVFTPNSYKVTFNANGGGSPTPASKTVRYKEQYGTLATISRPGYTFLGWFTAATGGTKVNPSDVYTTLGGQTLYAHWLGNELIVTYNPNGGLSNRYFDRVRVGAYLPALPSATWGSETTSRWFTSKTGGSEVRQGDTVTQTDDFTLYAHWSIPVNTHTLTFNANGGTVSAASRTLAEGAAYGTLPTPTRSGYTFVEWRTAPFVGELVTAATTIGTDDVTIYAIWRGNSITITLNPNGGTVSPATKSVENGSVYGILPRPTRSGFIFDGWWTAATGGTKITATDKPSGNQTVYAHWKQDGGEVVPWVF